MLRSLRSTLHVQLDAGFPSCLRISSNTMQLRCDSSSVASPTHGTDESVMGMTGTPVTKKLWQERLTKNKDRLKHLPLPELTAKPPQNMTVTYPFSSDRLLQEQVCAPVLYCGHQEDCHVTRSAAVSQSLGPGACGQAT